MKELALFRGRDGSTTIPCGDTFLKKKEKQRFFNNTPDAVYRNRICSSTVTNKDNRE